MAFGPVDFFKYTVSHVIPKRVALDGNLKKIIITLQQMKLANKFSIGIAHGSLSWGLVDLANNPEYLALKKLMIMSP